MKMQALDVAPPSDRLHILRNNSDLRRNTFTKRQWQEPAKIDTLVRRGFSFVGSGGNDDLIQCSHCGGILHGFHTDVLREHDLNFPRCPSIVSYGYSRIDFGGSAGCSRMDNCFVDQRKEGRIEVDGAPCSGKKIYDQENYRKFRNHEERLKSFEGWPEDSHMKPEDLAQAGLYYSGDEDKCICHYCGGELDQWEEGDIPKEEHDRNFISICGLCDV